MATLKEVSGKLESVRDGQSVQSKVLIDGQENQTKVQTSNSEALVTSVETYLKVDLIHPEMIWKVETKLRYGKVPCWKLFKI